MRGKNLPREVRLEFDVEKSFVIFFNVKFSSSKLNQEVIATGTITNNDIVGTDADADISGTSEDDNISGGGIDKIDWWCRR